MNSAAQEAAERCARDAGALVSCPGCHEYLVSAKDEKANRQTYALAVDAWLTGQRGFSSMTREEVMGVVKSVLEDADDCPRCTAQTGGSA